MLLSGCVEHATKLDKFNNLEPPEWYGHIPYARRYPIVLQTLSPHVVFRVECS